MVKLMLLNHVNWRPIATAVLFVCSVAGISPYVAAQTGANVRATKHNLSTTGTGSVKATSETQVCVFCHTPHGANTSANTPLWNRSGTALQTYTPYTSSSLDATSVQDALNGVTGGSSMLCLSCHDGVIALGNVNVLNGKAYLPTASPPTIALTGTSSNKMPIGSGVNTGYTRTLGTDLSNDHPISITFNDALASADGELAQPSTNGTIIGIRSSSVKPLLPLEPTGTGKAGQVQCATCHDPHITKDKFLRLNRFQGPLAPTATFSQANDQICLACHRKLGTAWSQSAHANTTSAAYVYKDDASLVRGFPRPSDVGAPPLKKVWEVACLNCHDTHTASGSRRLLREGTGSGAPVGASNLFQAGSTTRPLDTVSSIENTCYQCHNTTTASILTGTTLTATTGVPDIFSEFARTVRMPIKTADQTGGTTVETHDIRNANLIECRKTLGNTTATEESGTHLTAAQKTTCNSLIGSNDNRHVECTDCHNPHRVVKNALFNGLGAATQRTHTAGGAAGNIASGVLRGAWGVEPVFAAMGTIWPQAPTSFTVKKGDPGLLTATDRGQTYLTREYQLCFKCHSNYAVNSFPARGNNGGGTLDAGANGLTNYTNVAAEFGSVNATDPPSTFTDQGEETRSGTACGSGTPGVDCDPTPSAPGGANNHRSWHPVMWPTGRDSMERTGGTTFSNIRAPFNVKVGTQTMYCSDCHGDPGSWTAGTGPNPTTVQGPHGSSKPFLLKGDWDLPASGAGTTPSSPGVCGNCHNPTGGVSGFAGASEASHGWDQKNGTPCNYCHIAVPHGWKNKAFLVNLNCVGPESGEVGGYDANNCKAKTGLYSAAPYYRNAVLRINAWRYSGNWSETSCGDGTGKTWMTEVCGLW